jgi:hypothetical protein
VSLPNLYGPAFDPEQPEADDESPDSKTRRLHQLIADRQTTGADALRAALEHHDNTTK